MVPRLAKYPDFLLFLDQMDLNEEVNIDQEFTDHEQSKQVLPVDDRQIEEDELSDTSIPNPRKDDTQLVRTTGSPKRSGSPVLHESTMRVVFPVKEANPPARQASPARTVSHGVNNLLNQSATVPDPKEIKDPASQIWSIIQNTSKPSSMNVAPKSQPTLHPIVNIDYLEAERKFNEFEVKYQLIVNENKRLIKEKEECALEKKILEQKLTLAPVKPASDNYELELVKKELLLAKQELNTRSASLTKVKRELETQSELALKIQSESSSLSYKVTLREEELRSKTLQIERLREELNQRNSFHVQQKQKDLEAFDSIRQELSKKTSENLSLESKANGLQNQLSLVEKELQSKHALIRDLQNEKLLAEQQFLDEIKSQKKLTQVYEEQYNQVVNDNEELKELVQKLDESVDKLQKLQYSQQQDHEKALSDARNKIEVQQNEIKNLKEELSIVNSDLLKNSVSVQISHLSGTAAAATQIQKSGKSITEMFSEYSRLQVELASEKAEVSRLNECIARIVAEFEERAPIIQKTNDEFQKSRKLVEQLSLQLQASIEEKEHAFKEKTLTLAAMKEKENEILLLSKEVQDRSRQVQVLLREQFLLKGGHHSAAPDVGLGAGESHEADADQVISQRLVVFRNIEELQMQNSNLLRSIRSLSATLEEQEAQKSSNIESARLESIQETTAIIEQLKEQLQRERNSAEMYRKERNTWKALSENHAGHQEQVHVAEITRGEHDCEFKVNLAEIKEDFDIYRKESTANNKKLQFLLQQANDENAGINLQISSLKNQILYLNGYFF